ncbi:zeta toxin family protein [Dyadobacter sp. CY323]|uniref:zeta toxin family protein n=1 Tax=Dyadobacter sp. CY323 TaxID=2907302 RepID=UPI001F008B18|nr:zeta toxin family protein [Dyadobacter sp. CY323]MCE6989665.1 zeta toxin family protein [Dyadobacter sp. CY323]
MNYSNPTLLVVSGPNGAGKSTHIQAMLPADFNGIWSFDRDQTRSEFEVLLASQDIPVELIPKRASQLMEERLVVEMKKAIHAQNHFVLETPLSHPDYWKYLDAFENNGYQIQLNFLCLDKISDCVARVGQRVLEGGHYVPPDTIRGVYEKNLQHVNDYRRTFKCIELYDGMKYPILLAKLENDQVVLAYPSALQKEWLVHRMTSIAQKISAFLGEQRTSETQR